jgi:competence protein ComEC
MLPLFWIAAFFAAGILAGSLFPISVWIWAGICLAVFLTAILFSQKLLHYPIYKKWSDQLKVYPAVLLLAFCLGGLRVTLSIPHFSDNNLAWYNDRGSLTLVGVIDEPADRREDATYYHISVSELYDPETLTYRRLSGQALVRMDANAAWKLGDELRFTANPLTPNENEDFSYRRYLERQGVYTIIYHPTSVERVDTGKVNWFMKLLDQAHRKATSVIYALFPQPESSLLDGILLGNDNNLPEEVKQAYQNTGTAHIIAISGFNMTVLAVVFIFILSRFISNRWAYLITFIILFVYAQFVGNSVSVVRALIMAVVAYSGQMFGRKGGGLNALGLAALLMLAVNPKLISDASFQLSFGATAGLILFANPLMEKFHVASSLSVGTDPDRAKSNVLTETFFTSLSAQLTTLPVIALQFGRLSLTSLLANPLVLPVQQIILIGGMITVVVGAFWQGAGKVLAFLLWPLLAYSNRVVELLAQIPDSSLMLTSHSALWLSIGTLILISGGILYFYRMKWWKKIKPVYFLLMLAVGAILVWTFALRQPDGNLHISMFRSGDEMTLILRSPGGSTLLLDPAGSMNSLSSSISQSMPPWSSHIDAVLFTQKQSLDALNELNERLPVNSAVFTPPAFDAMRTSDLPVNVQGKELIPGESINLDDKVMVKVLGSDQDSSALLIQFGNFKAFLPNGMDPAELSAESRFELKGLSLLILDDSDLDVLPADMWQNLGAREIFWRSASLPPVQNWGAANVSITTNGVKVW